MTKAPFSIYRYSSYTEYFQDAYEAIHARDESFSYDRIAKLADLKSRTLARNLIKGQQKPTLAQLRKLALCFGLDAEEQEYAACLYQFQGVQGSAASFELFQRLARLQKQKLPEIDPFKDIEVATSVLHMTLLALFGLENPPRDPAGVTAALRGRYAEAEVAAAIADLESLRYVERRAEGGWNLLQKHIKNYDVNANAYLRRYHDQCLRVAGEALHRGGTDDRYLIGASFAINQKVYPRIIQKLNAFMENLMQLEGVAGGTDTVVQVSTQLVRMTEPAAMSAPNVPPSAATDEVSA